MGQHTTQSAIQSATHDTTHRTARLAAAAPVALIALLALTVFVAVEAPRVMSWMPIVIGVVFFPLHRWATGRWPPIPPLALWAVGGTLALATASLAWAGYPETSASKVAQLWALLPPMVLFMAVMAAYDPTALRPHLWAIPAACAAAWALMCAELATGGALSGGVQGRALPYYQYNQAMVALAAVSLPALALAPRRWWVALVLIPMAAACAMTHSQSAQLTLALGAALYLLVPHLPWRCPWVWRGAAAVIVTAMVAFPFAAPYVYAHYAQDMQAVPWLAAGAAGHRLEGWDYIARYALQQPWTGYGIEATRAITDFDSGRVFVDGNLIIHPHSALLQVWIEFGALGVALVGAALFALAEALRRAYARADDPAAARKLQILVPTIVAGMGVPLVFAYGMWQSWMLGLFFVAAGLAVWAMRVQDTDARGRP
jgi:O-antigen ligase